MLSKADKRNILNFYSLKEGHKRVFKYRLRGKLMFLMDDLNFILTHIDVLKLEPEDIIDPNQMKKVLDLYEKVCVTKFVNKSRKSLLI